MSGKSAPELIVTSEEIALAFKRSGLHVSKFAGFDEGYRLGAMLRAEEAYVATEQSPVTHVEVRS